MNKEQSMIVRNIVEGREVFAELPTEFNAIGTGSINCKPRAQLPSFAAFYEIRDRFLPCASSCGLDGP